MPRQFSGTWKCDIFKRYPYDATIVRQDRNELEIIVVTTPAKYYCHVVMAKLMIFPDAVPSRARAHVIDMDTITQSEDFEYNVQATKCMSTNSIALLTDVLRARLGIEKLMTEGVEAYLLTRGIFEGVCKLRPACKMLGESPVPEPVLENILEMASERTRLRSTLEHMRSSVAPGDPTWAALNGDYRLIASRPFYKVADYKIALRSEPLAADWFDLWSEESGYGLGYW